MIDKDTQVCISVSGRPSNFGTTVHNAAYAALGLNFIYKAFAVSDLQGAIAGVRALGIRGCSVSMPYKTAVIPYLDRLEESAKAVSAVNTIVNEAGVLTGHNTDVAGARAALESIAIDPAERVLLVGAGGAARAILHAMRQLGFTRVRVANRNPSATRLLDPILHVEPVEWSGRQDAQADVFINATPIGMDPEPGAMAVDEEFIRRTRAVMDVVVSPPESRLVRCARSAGKAVAPGHFMSLHQAMAQFSLYTGAKAPEEVMALQIRNLMENSAAKGNA